MLYLYCGTLFIYYYFSLCKDFLASVCIQYMICIYGPMLTYDFSKRLWLNCPSFWKVPAQEFYSGKSVRLMLPWLPWGWEGWWCCWADYSDTLRCRSFRSLWGTAATSHWTPRSANETPPAGCPGHPVASPQHAPIREGCGLQLACLPLTVRLILDKPGRWRAADCQCPLSSSWLTPRSPDHWRRWGLVDWCYQGTNQPIESSAHRPCSRHNVWIIMRRLVEKTFHVSLWLVIQDIGYIKFLMKTTFGEKTTNVLRKLWQNGRVCTYRVRDVCSEYSTNMETETGDRSDCSLSLKTHGNITKCAIKQI